MKQENIQFVQAIFQDAGIKPMKRALLNKTEFENIGKVHDWRKYVSKLYQREWCNLTYREKVIIYCEAEYHASREEWD